MIYGIVAEYNPFHKGHKHLIDSVKGEDDFFVAVMSGNFVQRGDFAITDKWSRTKTALDGGVDLVIELPTPFALQSAYGFAHASLTLLESTKIIDKLLFGAECSDINELTNIARKLDDEKYNEMIKSEVKKGVSYPCARQNAIGSSIIQTPNNILAVEYIRAIKNIHSGITPVAVQRIGSNHDSLTQSDFPSASMIRKTLMKNSDTSLMSRCDNAMLSKLRRMNAEDFAKIQDVTEGLENKIESTVKSATNMVELFDGIKSKRYTSSRIRRIVLRAYLDIYNNDFPSMPYIRILGFNERGIQLIKKMRANASLPIIQQYSDIKNANAACKELFKKECLCTDLFALSFQPPLPCSMEMTKSIVKNVKK